MPGMRDNGSILLSLLLLIVVLYSGIFLFVRVVNAQVLQVKYARAEVRLQLLGHSGIARGRWLLKNKPGEYLIDLSHVPQLDDKIVTMGSSAVYREVVEGEQLLIGFSPYEKVFYVVVSSYDNSIRYSVRRFYSCSYVSGTDTLPTVQIN